MSNIFTTTNDSSIQNGNKGGLSRKPEETYSAWGTRYAGATNAEKQALRPALDQVILTNKEEQIGNTEEQERRKNAIQAEITTKRNDITALEQKKENKDSEKESINNQIAAKKKEINGIKEGKDNRGLAKVQFWVFLTITIGLALYLFVFYSSAAYSAFFGGNYNNVTEAIFNPHALQDAGEQGIFALFLILLFPTLFIGLGLKLHSFSKKQGSFKYVKIVLLYATAFCFDALLAYKISEMFFVPTPQSPQYTPELAFNSVDFWFVIFCGFIAYLIWGLVFDETMENYQEMTEGAVTINRLKREILDCENQIKDLNEECAQYDNKINELRNEIARHEYSLHASTWFDITIIKRCLNEFFIGWIGYMSLAGMNEQDKSDAKDILNSRLSSLTQNTINYNEK